MIGFRVPSKFFYGVQGFWWRVLLVQGFQFFYGLRLLFRVPCRGPYKGFRVQGLGFIRFKDLAAV